MLRDALIIAQSINPRPQYQPRALALASCGISSVNVCQSTPTPLGRYGLQRVKNCIYTKNCLKRPLSKSSDDTQGGGGGTLIFSAYVDSDPASNVHSKKISRISSTPKKYLKF